MMLTTSWPELPGSLEGREVDMGKKDDLPPDPGRIDLRQEFEVMMARLEQQREDLAWLIELKNKEKAPPPTVRSITSPADDEAGPDLTQDRAT
ncbi:MAG: hypothetical protein Q8O14_02035 [bacterium]|jgi:hypothetical protein|nr:hypothetical protein [bacterium]